MNNADFKMALVLQDEFNKVGNGLEVPRNGLVYSDKKKKNRTVNVSPSKCLIDPSWELIDPTPDIHVLFMAFNDRFFWKKLYTVTVAWSKRMTTCAGVCSFQSWGKECKITLSEPLLKLRPRKDLVETLLHEMIHALLFLTNKDRDGRDGHGPEFHKHMYRINNEAGTNITVYHDFHDEVRLYQQHWWRCNGPCQKWRPYYGFVKRSINRAPGPSDMWWKDHQYKCGGTFIKVKEPEKAKKGIKSQTKTGGKENKKKNMGDITKYIVVSPPKPNGNIKSLTNTKGSNFGTKNKNGTVVLNPKTNKTQNAQTKTLNTKGNIKTINDFKEPNIKNNTDIVNNNTKPLGNVFTINTIDSANSFKKPRERSQSDSTYNMDHSLVRKKWIDKYDTIGKTNDDKNKNNRSKRHSVSNDTSSPKKQKTASGSKEIKQNRVNCPVCNKIVDSDSLNDHLDNCLQDDTSIETIDLTNKVICPVCKKGIEESLMDEHLDVCLYKTESGNKPSTSKIVDRKQCEICDKFINTSDFDVHMQDCLHKLYDDIEKKYNFNSTKTDFTDCLVCNQSIKRTELNGHLDTCMGTAFQGNMHEEFDDKDEDNDESGEKKYNCPICLELVEESAMNKHIDLCLN